MIIRLEPMPSMRAPICMSRRARSCTCGSEAALWITVEPAVSAAAMSAFSVAMTEGSSMKKSHACRPSAACRSYVRPERAEGVEVGVEAAPADYVAARWRHVRPAEARQQRAGEQEGGADALGEVGVNIGPGDLVALDGDHVLVAPLGLRAEPCEQLHHRLHVADVRHVAQHHLLAREERSGERWQSSIFVAGGDHCSGERRPALDDELLHSRYRRGRRPGKGIEGHSTRGSGRRPDTLHCRVSLA